MVFNPFLIFQVASSLWLVVLAIVTVWLLMFFSRRFFSNRHDSNKIFARDLLLITVPQYSKTAKKNENTKQEIKELIAVVETFYSVLGGLKPEKGWAAWWHGRHDHFTLELVSGQDGILSFYVSTPVKLRQFLEHQILAQFSDAQIEQVEDYNIFQPQGVVVGATVRLQRDWIFPILTYDKMQSDPLNSLTNSLSKLGGDDTAAVQFVIRSAKKAWHKRGHKVASEMQQGKKLNQAVAAVNRNETLKTLSKIWEDFQPKENKDNHKKETYHLSPLEEEMTKSLQAKAAKAGFDVNIRIITSAKT